eukprot:240746_1
MSLTIAVQFRSLASQLTNEETLQFIQTVAQQPNDIIITALFQHIIESEDHNTAKNINDLITNIIESRPEEPQSNTQNIVQLNNIPKPLINIAASYLPQKDYISLSQSNRHIFIACNSPKNALQELDLSRIAADTHINLSLFHSKTRLKIDPSTFRRMKLPFDIFNYESISHLQVYGYFTSFSANQQLLAKFPNVQYLQPCHVSENLIQNTYSELKGLDLTHTLSITKQKSLLVNYGHSLDFLSFRYDHTADYNAYVSELNFRNLEQLKIFRPPLRVNVMQEILRSATNIKAVSLKQIHNAMEKQTLKSMCMTILRCELLEYMELDMCDALLVPVLEVINECLCEINRQTHQIKIRITTTGFSLAVEQCRQNVKLRVGNVISWLKRYYEHFMFILDINANAFYDEIKDILRDVQVEKFGGICLITNRGCIIDGFGQSWKM